MTELAPAAGARPSSRLAHFPITFFATVMGLTGLSMATLRFEQHFQLAHAASLAIGALAAAVFVAVAAIYAAKTARHRAAVIAEWGHPVRLSFFATISISLVLLSITALPVHALLAEALWVPAAALQLYATLTIVSAWIGRRPFATPDLNPAWFIPAVGNIIVPMAGVPLGHVEISWFFYAIGFLFWLVLMTLVFNRLIFHNPLPERLLPMLMILVAPPSVAFLAYLRLTGGPLDAFGRVMFYSGLALFLVVATQAPRLVRVPFSLTWWAYSFPLAALTTATAVYAELVSSPALVAAFIGLYALLVAVLALLAVNTIRAIIGGEICRPEA